MSGDDWTKLILTIVAPGGVVALAVAAVFNKLMSSCQQCCEERDEYRKKNDAALEAYRKRDEELAAWQRQEATRKGR